MKRKAFAVMVLVSLCGLLPGCELVAARALSEFSLELTPDPLEVEAGSDGELEVKVVRPINVLPSAIRITLENPYPDLDAHANEISTESEGVLIIAVDASSPPGDYTLTIRGENSMSFPPVTKTETFTLRVLAATPD